MQALISVKEHLLLKLYIKRVKVNIKVEYKQKNETIGIATAISLRIDNEDIEQVDNFNLLGLSI